MEMGREFNGGAGWVRGCDRELVGKSVVYFFTARSNSGNGYSGISLMGDPKIKTSCFIQDLY